MTQNHVRRGLIALFALAGLAITAASVHFNVDPPVDEKTQIRRDKVNADQFSYSAALVIHEQRQIFEKLSWVDCSHDDSATSALLVASIDNTELQCVYQTHLALCDTMQARGLYDRQDEDCYGSSASESACQALHEEMDQFRPAQEALHGAEGQLKEAYFARANAAIKANTAEKTTAYQPAFATEIAEQKAWRLQREAEQKAEQEAKERQEADDRALEVRLGGIDRLDRHIEVVKQTALRSWRYWLGMLAFSVGTIVCMRLWGPTASVYITFLRAYANVPELPFGRPSISRAVDGWTVALDWRGRAFLKNHTGSRIRIDASEELADSVLEAMNELPTLRSDLQRQADTAAVLRRTVVLMVEGLRKSQDYGRSKAIQQVRTYILGFAKHNVPKDDPLHGELKNRAEEEKLSVVPESLFRISSVQS